MAEKSAIPVELGTEPIGKLLKNYAVPAIIAMTASSLYNIIDSIFIGHGVGPLAIAGLAVTFPLMNLSAAFGGSPLRYSLPPLLPSPICEPYAWLTNHLPRRGRQVQVRSSAQSLW